MILTNSVAPELTLYLNRDASADLTDYVASESSDDWDEGEGYGEEAGTSTYSRLETRLGSGRPTETYVILDAPGKVSILVDDLRVCCIKQEAPPLLKVQRIERLSEPIAERLRGLFAQVIISWRVVTQAPPLSGPSEWTTAAATLSDFLASLWSAYHSRQKNRSRRDVYAHWTRVLEYQEERLEDSPGIPYLQGVDLGDVIKFILPQRAPRRPSSWRTGAPLALVDPVAPGKPRGLGTLKDDLGDAILVNVDHLDEGQRRDAHNPFDQPGELCLDPFREQRNIERQKRALSAFQGGRTANPRIADAVVDIGMLHVPRPRCDLDLPNHLSDDKQEAIRQALATNDIFVLQGPPGTGKTTTLTALIALVLKQDQNLRLLISSPSNAAVDNLLKSLDDYFQDHDLEMVRIDNKSGGKVHRDMLRFRVDKKAQDWRKQGTSRRSKAEKKAQRQRERLQRHLEKAPLSALARADLCHHADLLDLLEDDLATLVSNQYQHETLMRNAVVTTMDAPTIDDAATVTLASTIGRSSEVITSILEDARAALHDHGLHEVIAVQASDDVHEEVDRLRWIMVCILDPQKAEQIHTEHQAWLQRWDDAYQKSPDVYQVVIARATIVAATCAMVAGSDLRDQEYDWVFIDEAGQATVPQTLIPMVRARRCILVGDERQLPPHIDSTELSTKVLKERLHTTREELEQSLFQQLVKRAHEVGSLLRHQLTEQHRMHHGIGSLISHVFYDRTLTNAPQTYGLTPILPRLDKPVLWLSTTLISPRAWHETSIGDSFYNNGEVQEITRFLHQLQRDLTAAGSTKIWSVGVIAAYKPQVDKLAERIQPTKPSQDQVWKNLDIEIDTVDSFQGRQKEVILYSAVRSNNQRDIGFLRDTRRLNVALSRARVLLVIVGDLAHLEHANTGSDVHDFPRITAYIKDHPDDCIIQEVLSA